MCIRDSLRLGRDLLGREIADRIANENVMVLETEVHVSLSYHPHEVWTVPADGLARCSRIVLCGTTRGLRSTATDAARPRDIVSLASHRTRAQVVLHLSLIHI